MNLKGKKWVKPLLLVLTVMVLFGGLSYVAPDVAMAKGEKSNASKLFDAIGKNGSIIYFDDDNPGGMQTVQTLTSEEYAAFLKTMYDWNLYRTYTNQLDTFTGAITMLARAVMGSIMLLAIYMAKVLDFLIGLVISGLDVFNIFKYLPTGSEALPKSLEFLQPIVDIVQGLSGMALTIVTILFAAMLFGIITGFGDARSGRGRFALRRGGKILAAVFAAIGFPLMLAGMISSFATLMKSEGGYFTQSVATIPLEYIVDTDSWIKRSMAAAVGGNGSPDTFDGFVLLHNLGGGESFPKTKEEVLKKEPTPDFVKELNRVGAKDTGVTSDMKTSGEKAMVKWMMGGIVTPTEIDSMFGISADDSGKGESAVKETWTNIVEFFGGDADEKRIYQFRLAPYTDKVKAFSGKGFADVTSLDLNEVSIKTAVVAGNGGLGVFMNTVAMFFQIVGIVVVSVILMFGVLSGILRAITLMFANGILAMFASIQAMMAALVAFIMMAVTTISALMLISIYAELTKGLSSSIPTAIGNRFTTTNGVILAIVNASVIATISIGTAILLLKSRRAIIAAIEEFFQNLLTKLGFSPDSRAGGALKSMSAANERGQDLALAGMSAAGSVAGGAALGFGAGLKQGVMGGSLGDVGKTAGKGALEGTKKGLIKGATTMSGSISEGLDTLSTEGEVSPLAAFAGAMKAGTEKVKGLTSAGQAMSQLEDQSDAMNKLEAASAEKERADSKVANLKAERAEMERNGATPKELAAMDKKINKAEAEARQANGRFDRAAERAAESGAFVGIAAEEKAKAVEDKEKAQQGIQDAEREVEDARNEIRRLENKGIAVGSNNPEMQKAEARLASAESELEAQKGAYDRANAMIEGDVVDTEEIKREQENLAKVETDIKNAHEEMVSIQEDGGLSDNEYKDVAKVASNVEQELSGAESTLKERYTHAQSVEEAHEHMNQNAGYTHTAESIEQAEKGQGYAQSELKAEEAKLEQMQASGASAEAIEAQSQVVAQAQTAAAIADKVATGTKEGTLSVQDVQEMEARQGDMKSQRAAQAERVQSLEAAGAPPAEVEAAKASLQSMDSAIATAGAAIATAKSGEKTGRAFTHQDVERAQESVNASRQELEKAEVKLDQMKSANAPTADIEAQQSKVDTLQSQHASNVAQATAMDIPAAKARAQQQVNATSQSLAQETQKLEEMKAQGASQNVIKQQEAVVAKQSTANQAAISELSGITSGKTLNEAYNAAKQTKVQTTEAVSAAQAKVNEIQERQNQGATVGKDELSNAQRELTQAKAADHQAGRVLAGMNAQKVTGGETSENARQAAKDEVQRTGKNLEKVQQARQAANQVLEKGAANASNIVPMMEAQKVRMEEQRAKVAKAEEHVAAQKREYDNLVQRKQAGDGSITVKQVTAAERALKAATSERAQAARKLSNIQDDMNTLSATGAVITKNAKAAKVNIKQAEGKREEANVKYQEAVKNGGLNPKTIVKTKERLNNEKELVKKGQAGRYYDLKKGHAERMDELDEKHNERTRKGQTLDKKRNRDERERRYKYRYNNETFDD